MLRSFKLFATFAAALGMAGCNAGGSGVPATIGQSTSEARVIPQWQGAEPRASRLSRRPSRRGAMPGSGTLNKGPQDNEPGWGAHDIEAAYSLFPSSTKGAGQIVCARRCV